MADIRSKDSKPNIILIVLDAVRWDHLSCYGYPRATTPNIDRIAGEGIVFTRAYAASCWTLPAHTSLFTGLYPSQHHTNIDSQTLDPRHLTIAGYLKDRGYHTASISCNAYISDYTNLSNGFALSVDIKRAWKGQNGPIAKILHTASRWWRDHQWEDNGAQRATKLAGKWLSNLPDEKPFFLFMNYMECHLPYRLRLPQKYQFVKPADRQRVDQVPQDPYAYMAGMLQYSQQDLADIQALYDGSLFYLDQQIGQLEEQLKSLGRWENTIFILTSDHGESFGEHGLMDHQYGLYENQIRVPLIMRLPNREKAGERVDSFVQHIDLFPTLVHFLPYEGLHNHTPQFLGFSIFDGLPREDVIAEYLVPNIRSLRRRFPDVSIQKYDQPLRAITTREYKLIDRKAGRKELYNLLEDSDECANLADERPEKVEQLQARLSGVVGAWPNAADTDAAAPQLSDELRKRLEELGYL